MDHNYFVYDWKNYYQLKKPPTTYSASLKCVVGGLLKLIAVFLIINKVVVTGRVAPILEMHESQIGRKMISDRVKQIYIAVNLPFEIVVIKCV